MWNQTVFVYFAAEKKREEAGSAATIVAAGSMKTVWLTVTVLRPGGRWAQPGGSAFLVDHYKEEWLATSDVPSASRVTVTWRVGREGGGSGVLVEESVL